MRIVLCITLLVIIVIQHGAAYNVTMVTELADMISSCAQDGGIAMYYPTRGSLNPYFAAFGVLGLARAAELTGNTTYLEYVGWW